MVTDYEAIARAHRRYYGEGDRHLRIYRRLYDDETHFVYELVQNADDSGSLSLKFWLRDHELVVVNDGRRFNESEKDDVRDICSIGLSEKDLTQIGSFGIGFKAVYAYSAAPEIYSGVERFQIHRLIEPAQVSAVRPDIGELLAAGKTVFRLPFKGDLPEAKLERLANRLADLHPWTLLFLRHLESIEWRDDRSGAAGSYSRDRAEHPSMPHASVVSLMKCAADGERRERFLVFRKQDETLMPPAAVVEDLKAQAEDEHEQERVLRSAGKAQSIEIAFLMQEDRIVSLDKAVLFSCLPTSRETQLRFLFQARYQTTPARDNLPKENSWNDWLLEETANFLAEVVGSLRSKRLLQPSFYDIVPLDSDAVPDMLQPVLTAFRQIMTEDSILTESGEYGTPSKVLNPNPSELRSLLSSDQLDVLTGLLGAKWLHPELKQGRRLAAIQALGVKSFTPDKMAAGITADFMARQTDEWITRLYVYLKDHEMLWRRGERGAPDGTLRRKPIIRTEREAHVEPFHGDDPLVYLPPDGETEFPTVKRSVLNDPGALDFLKRLGLNKPSVEDEVIFFILPKYDGSNVEDLDHAKHMVMIMRALCGDSKASRDRVEAKLREAKCFRVVNGVTGKWRYEAAREAYLPSPALKEYFAGNASAWFLDEACNPTSPADFEQAMIRLGVNDKPRRLPFDPKFDEAQLKIIRGGARVTRNTSAKVTDFDLEGLDHFLGTLAQKTPEDAARAAYLLWEFLLAYIPADMRPWEKVPKVFQGIYVYQMRGDNPCPFEPRFLRCLREASWLPDGSGNLRQPSKLASSDLPANFRRSEVLEVALKMVPPEATVLAEKLGIDPSMVEYLQDGGKVALFKKWVAEQSPGNSGSSSGGNSDAGKPDPNKGTGNSSGGGGGHRSGGGGGGSGGHTGGGSGGEGQAHEHLKNRIAANPQLLEPGMRLHRRECSLESGYRPDLILQDSAGRYVAVEVETGFPGGNDTGMWQAIAYKHIFAVECGVPCSQVRGILVAPKIPESIRARCRKYDVEPFEVGE